MSRRKRYERKEQGDASRTAPRKLSFTRNSSNEHTQPALLEQSKNNAKSGSWVISRQ